MARIDPIAAVLRAVSRTDRSVHAVGNRSDPQIIPARAVWHLRATVTIRTVGSSATAIGNTIIQDDGSSPPFVQSLQTATINTTTSLNIDLRASIQDYTGTESILCDQLVVHLE